MYSDIQGNAEQFARSLEALAEQTQKDVNDIIVKALSDLLAQIMNTTPKETCRARGSWMLDDQWGNFQLPPGDYTGVDIGARVAEMVAALPESTHYVIYNNLEYIVPLENGHSKKQAPQGFVAQALAAFASQFARAAKSKGYEGTI